MADYRVTIKPSAAKELDQLPSTATSRVIARIESLSSHPRPHGVKKLEGSPVRWRVRIGDWRIIDSIEGHPHARFQ